MITPPIKPTNSTEVTQYVLELGKKLEEVINYINAAEDDAWKYRELQK